MSRRGRSRLGVVLLLGIACSTIADQPAEEECTVDNDCAEGFVCAIDQGLCLPGNEAAPRAHLGFDVRERAAGEVRYRVEVDGCDCTIDEEENIRELALRYPLVSQEFELKVSLPGAPEEPEPDDLVGGEFRLSQPSRFGQAPSPQEGRATYPTLAGDNVVPTILPWPRYHPLDVNRPPEMVLWKVEPTGEFAQLYLGLTPFDTDPARSCTTDAECCEPAGACDPSPNYCDTNAGQCTLIGLPGWRYEHVYEPDCSRAVRGSVYLLRDDLTRAGPLPGATVLLRYADHEDGRIGTPVLDNERDPANRPPQCNDDDDCGDPNRYCDVETRQCFIALAGRSAANDAETIGNGQFENRVHTYCDLVPGAAVERSFEVSIIPNGPLPTVNFQVDRLFEPKLDESEDPRDIGEFCVPDWGVNLQAELEGQGMTMELRFEGQRAQLLDEYACCDVGCLPSTAEDAEAGPPNVTEPCDGSTSAGAPPEVEVEAFFDFEDLDAWTNADCAPLLPDADGHVGSLVRTAQCGDPELPCRVENIASGTDEQPRTYHVRIESPVGSVVASDDFEVSVTSQAPVEPLELRPRVLVRGVVDVDETTCARRESGEDCAAREAVVLAERIRLPGEAEGSIPGPHFHNVPTFYDPVAQRDGAFVLPLDPGGIYVITALPLAGAEGGPARFSVVDLRPEAAETLQPLRLVLEDGVLVTLRLNEFDPRTTVIPLDRGSYLVEGQQLINPMLTNTADPFIDLNEVGTCWSAPRDGPQGCQIRRLIPPGSDLSRSQVGIVRFTARRSDRADCTQQCTSGASG